MGIAPSTRRGYNTGQRCYLSFCHSSHIVRPIPASPELLCFWAANLSARVTYKTIRNYLNGVRNLHIESGFKCPTDDPLLIRLMNGIRRVYGDRTRPRTLPVTFGIVNRMRSQIDYNNHNHRMNIAAIAIATAGLFRIGEISATAIEPERYPRMRDVTWFDRHITIHLRVSKTDPYGQGVDVMVAHPLAIRDLTRYLNGCSDSARAGHAPLFAWKDGRVLTRRALLSVAVRLVDRAGIHLSQYQGISFRRGGATSLAMAGRPDRVIQILGRWKSQVFKRYIERRDTALLIQAATGSRTTG